MRQVRIGRQAKYCREHHISKYHHHSDEKHPLSARITCAACGCNFILLTSNRVGEEGRKYWRYGSFHGGRGVELAGRTFTPKPMALWNKQPDSACAHYRAKHRKLPTERQMLCTDIEIPTAAPEQAFVEAWNQEVGKRERYMEKLAHITNESHDPLLCYRAWELQRLTGAVKKLKQFDYALSLKVLDHIEVGLMGSWR